MTTSNLTSEVAPTPGPWSIGHALMRGDPKYCQWPEVPVHVGDGPTRGNCFVHVMGGGPGAGSSTMESAIANARLIAAAPDLLATLRGFVAAAKSWHDFHHESSNIQCDWFCEAIPAAEAAIAKAEGRT